MKKIQLLFIGLCVSGLSFAQSGAKFFAGGGIGFESSSVKDNNTENTFSLTPTFAYMLNGEMGVGVNVSFNNVSRKWDDSDRKNNQNIWYAEPFFRYYIPASEKFKFFGDLGVAFGGGKETDTDAMGDQTETKLGYFGINLMPGAQYWFTSQWSMATNIGRFGYNSTTNDKGGNNEQVTNNFGLNLDFASVKFGLFYHF